MIFWDKNAIAGKSVVENSRHIGGVKEEFGFSVLFMSYKTAAFS